MPGTLAVLCINCLYVIYITVLCINCLYVIYITVLCIDCLYVIYITEVEVGFLTEPFYYIDGVCCDH